MSVVVKLGGHALDDLSPHSETLAALAGDVLALRAEGTSVAIVHGGGPQIASLLDELGRPSLFHDGLRVTDDATMEVVAMALALVNHRLVAALSRAGLRCAGVSGVDDATITARAAGPSLGRAGVDPVARPDLVHALWGAGVTPVMSPVSLDAQGELLNCNADAAAGAVAAALGADALVLLSDIDQVRADPDDPESAVAHLSADQVREMLETGAAREGMRPKLRAALDALSGGAARVVLANGRRPGALLDVLHDRSATTEVTT